jgi:tetratricopeptide (TPR) repeat protein
LEAIQAVRRVAVDEGRMLDSRVGIATGQVVIGDIIGDQSAQSDAVVGETPNLAARLQGLAAPGEAVVGGQTRQLIAGAFDLEELGAQSLKGFADPVETWRVVAERSAESRFASGHAGHDSVFVGREDELQLLNRRWQQAAQGVGQVVLISGEPGIGKSRLCESFIGSLGDAPSARLRYQCAPLHNRSAYYPFIQQISRAAGLRVGDPPAAALGKLTALFDETQGAPAALANTLAQMMSLPVETEEASVVASPVELKQRIFDLLITQLAALGRERPVLVMMEDLHWIDPSSQDVLDQTIGRIADLPVLMLLSHRPEYEAPWVGEANVAAITLNRLDARQSRALADDVAGAPLEPDVLDEIAARSDGIPLFVEELTRSVIEVRDAGLPIDQTTIPATLHGILTERLDRLGEAREVAQVGAVVGRAFSFDLLAATGLVSSELLASGLEALESTGLIHRRGAVPDAVYTFKHALIQDAAYEGLLRRRRRELHGRIAKTIEDRFPSVAEQQPAVLAHHFAEADESARAAEAWFKAGRQAQHQFAAQEAIAHYSQAIASIEVLPDREAYAGLELDCYIGLGPQVLFARGPRDPDLSHHYQRALQLSDRIGDDRKSYTVKWGKWYVEHFGMGDPEAAVRTANELIDIGTRQNDRGLLLQAHHSGWTSGLVREDLRSTLEHVESGIRLYDPDEHRHQIGTYGGHDAGACCRWVGGMAYSIVGRLDRGAQLATESVATAVYVEHIFTEVIARSFGSTVHFLRRDDESLVAWVEAMEKTLGDRVGSFMHMVTTPRMLKGWAQVKSGQIAPGLELIEGNLAAIRTSGIPRLGFQLHILADAKRMAGDEVNAFAALAEGFEACAKTGEGLWLPELHRIKGEMLFDGKGNLVDEAEQELTQALTIARNQGAMLFELRAARALARLWAHQGKRDAARDLLAPIYGRFTEGFDMPDLTEAKALIDELG